MLEARGFFCCLTWQDSHSRAVAIVLDTMSSGVIHLSLKIVLFLAVQICQTSHGARLLYVIPAGGRLTQAQMFVQVVSKSIVPLASKLGISEAAAQTFRAKLHSKNK